MPLTINVLFPGGDGNWWLKFSYWELDGGDLAYISGWAGGVNADSLWE
jgi:hypothetical protein